MSFRDAPSVTKPSSSNLGQVPFRPTADVRKTSGYSQADTRRPLKCYDQHGRQWSCMVENRSGMPTGLITNDFPAPWLPDQGALVVNPANPSELWIDYRRMVRERQQALTEYHTHAVQLATEKGWPIPAKGQYSGDILRVLGRPSLPVEPVVAAAQENSWILGRTTTPDPRLVPFVTPPEAIEEELAAYDFSDASLHSAIETVDAAVPEAPAGYVGSVAPAVVEEDIEAPEADALASEAEDLLEALELDADPEFVGGRTVKPQHAAKVAKQAPRRPGQTVSGSSKAARRRQQAKQMGRSLADGATPGVSSAVVGTEFEVAE